MPSTKEPPSKKAGWGGKRRGAGRKRQLKIEHRKLIAQEYYKRMQERRELALPDRQPRRELVIRELKDELKEDLLSLTPRMIERVIAEFLPKIRQNAPIWA